MSMSGRDVVKKVRTDEEAVLIALQVEITPVDDQFAPLINRRLHKALDVGFAQRVTTGP